MFISLSKKIELVANLAIVVVACLLMTVLVKNYFVTELREQAPVISVQRALHSTSSSRRGGVEPGLLQCYPNQSMRAEDTWRDLELQLTR